MKGIVLAGGRSSRLWPMTKAISKQLLPVFDKPMIHYPISTLMLAGIRDILIITTSRDEAIFKELLGNGSDYGVNFSFATQPKPEGLAQALMIAEKFLAGEKCLMILGDNIFHGAGLGKELQNVFPEIGCHIFTYEVANPAQYGILTVNEVGNPVSIEEKPLGCKSKLAVTGLYFFDGTASSIASKVKPSARGELEITSVIQNYLESKKLTFTQLSRGSTWFDCGTPESLDESSTYIRIVQERTNLKIACIEEIAFRNGWISPKNFELLITSMPISSHRSYLDRIFSGYST